MLPTFILVLAKACQNLLDFAVRFLFPNQGLANFSCKVPDRNVVSFVGHSGCVPTTQLCCCHLGGVIYNTDMYEDGCVPITLFTETGSRLDLSLAIPALNHCFEVWQEEGIEITATHCNNHYSWIFLQMLAMTIMMALTFLKYLPIFVP